MVPSALARWVLARAVALGLEVLLAPASRRPLLGEAPVEGAVWMRLRGAARGPHGVDPALTDLPGVIAAYPVGLEAARLFVDVRCESPLSAALLESLLPGAAGVLGAADVGHVRVRVLGELVSGASLLNPAEVASAPLAVPGDARLPDPIPVRLVRRNLARRVDACASTSTRSGGGAGT